MRPNRLKIASSIWLAPVLLCIPVPTFGAERETRWSGLSAIVSGKQVVVELHSGGTMEGRAVSVNAAGFRIDVDRSDDDRFAASREHEIPRSAINRLQLIERGGAGRILGTVVGAVGGFFLAGAIFDKPGYIPIAQASGGAAAGGVGGFILGARIDRRITTIRLLPD